MSRNVSKRTFRHVPPTKIPIRLRIRAVWSESSLGDFWIARMQSFFMWQRRLIRQRECAVWIESSLGTHHQKVRFLSLRFKYIFNTKDSDQSEKPRQISSLGLRRFYSSHLFCKRTVYGLICVTARTHAVLSMAVRIVPASILRKSTSGRHRLVSNPDGPMTARYRFT